MLATAVRTGTFDMAPAWLQMAAIGGAVRLYRLLMVLDQPAPVLLPGDIDERYER